MLGISLSDRIGLALINGADLLAVITPHAARTVILHGHRHVDWMGITGQTMTLEQALAEAYDRIDQRHTGSEALTISGLPTGSIVRTQ